MEKGQRAKKEIRELTLFFHFEEKFKLTDQLIRSSSSVNAIFADSRGRYTFKDQLHYCIMARGFLSETYNYLFDVPDCNYINDERLNYYKSKIDEAERLLNGYISYLRKHL